MPRRYPSDENLVVAVSWPINDIDIRAHQGGDGVWRIRLSAFVNGEFRSYQVEAPAGRLDDGVARALGVFVTIHRDKEPL